MMFGKRRSLLRCRRVVMPTCLVCYTYALALLYIRLEPQDVKHTGYIFNRPPEDKLRNKGQKETSSFVELLPGVHAYSAYLDSRLSEPEVRIIATVNNLAPKMGMCNFWPKSSLSFLKKNFGDSLVNMTQRQRQERLAFFSQVSQKTLGTQLTFFETCEGHGLRNVAYYISCPVPAEVRGHVTTVVISRRSMWSSVDQLAEIPVTSIDIGNKSDGILTQRYGSKPNIGVCVPPLFGPVTNVSLVEFVEATRILGADYLVFYDFGISEELRKVLRFYQNISIATLLPWHLPFPDDYIWYHGQSAAIADCLHRTMGHFDWVIFNDIDEYIVPRSMFTTNGTIPEFLAAYEEIDEKGFSVIASLAFQSAIFEPPHDLFTNPDEGRYVSMDTIERTVTISDELTKMIVRPERVFELGIHHLSSASEKHFTGQLVSSDVALLHHYRQCRAEYSIECVDFVGDDTFTRHKTSLHEKVKKVLSVLNN